MSDDEQVRADKIRGMAVLAACFAKPRMDGTGVTREMVDEAERRIRDEEYPGNDTSHTRT